MPYAYPIVDANRLNTHAHHAGRARPAHRVLDRAGLPGRPADEHRGRRGHAHPATFLRVLGPEPWRVVYVEPSVRPDDSRYGENPNRLQTHTQLQVILKPDPGNPQELYLGSLSRARHRRDRARRAVRRGQLGLAGAGRVGPGLGGLAGRAGDHPVHLLPAGRRARPGPAVGGDHLRHRADHHGAAGRHPLQGHRVRRRASATARCSARPSTRCPATTWTTPTWRPTASCSSCTRPRRSA